MALPAYLLGLVVVAMLYGTAMVNEPAGHGPVAVMNETTVAVVLKAVSKASLHRKK
jgi:hypothetical protein